MDSAFNEGFQNMAVGCMGLVDDGPEHREHRICKKPYPRARSFHRLDSKRTLYDDHSQVRRFHPDSRSRPHHLLDATRKLSRQGNQKDRRKESLPEMAHDSVGNEHRLTHTRLHRCRKIHHGRTHLERRDERV